MSTKWPAHARERRAWQQTHRGGTRDDRMLREIEVSLPPRIAGRAVDIDAALSTELEAAVREIAVLDAAHGDQLEALGLLLLRTESVASSKIEAIDADLDDYARALHGIRSNPSAVAMAAATDALDALIGSASRERRVTIPNFLAAHRILMADDKYEHMHAGRFRDMQNWIGGSDHSPRGSLYIPPPPDTVADYMADLETFVNRSDLSALAQAAIAHAQFESIHPFTDGNGRIGRALINSVLRLRGVTTLVVVPLASALVARRDRYFELLTLYRTGDVRPLISDFARCAAIAAAQSRTTAERLREEIPHEWRDLLGGVRAGSAAAALLGHLPAHPILSAEEAQTLTNASRSSVFAAIDRLAEAGVLRPLTDRKHNQIWGAGAVLDELDDLGVRIADAARPM
ncbi:hypothetical protein NRB20_28630 [Nocardia sp. RB20]|uniref:Fido domain-containing protein n=1 Tax=Nocardia macrotermitis TaxID=2585198 RepID=A0A7K0D245_9NOCA|nr:hypothetical protein [Nocardia macrotermitis]